MQLERCSMAYMNTLRLHFMAFVDRLSGSRNYRTRSKKCDICNEKFVNIEVMEKHRRDAHSEMDPQKAEA